MQSASYEYRKMSARSGAQFVLIGMPTVCWKTFPAKTTKILSTRNSSILMMSSSEYLFLESECSFTKYVSSCRNTKYLYLRLPFLKMKDQRIKTHYKLKCFVIGIKCDVTAWTGWQRSHHYHMRLTRQKRCFYKGQVVTRARIFVVN